MDPQRQEPHPVYAEPHPITGLQIQTLDELGHKRRGSDKTPTQAAFPKNHSPDHSRDPSPKRLSALTAQEQAEVVAFRRRPQDVYLLDVREATFDQDTDLKALLVDGWKGDGRHFKYWNEASLGLQADQLLSKLRPSEHAPVARQPTQPPDSLECILVTERIEGPSGGQHCNRFQPAAWNLLECDGIKRMETIHEHLKRYRQEHADDPHPEVARQYQIDQEEYDGLFKHEVWLKDHLKASTTNHLGELPNASQDNPDCFQ
jgi:hypothetical protein